MPELNPRYWKRGQKWRRFGIYTPTLVAAGLSAQYLMSGGWLIHQDDVYYCNPNHTILGKLCSNVTGVDTPPKPTTPLTAATALQSAQVIQKISLYCPTGPYADYKLGIPSPSKDPNAYYCLAGTGAHAATVSGQAAVAMQVVLQPDYAKKVPNANLTGTFNQLNDDVCLKATKPLQDMAQAIISQSLGGTNVPESSGALFVDSNGYTLCAQTPIVTSGGPKNNKQGN